MRRAALPLAVTTALALTAAACFGGPSGNKAVPEPAKPVALGRYLGLWYEIARYDQSFETGCEGVTAEYAKRPDGLVSVKNTCREGGPDGAVRVSEGKAKIVEGSDGAKLKVSFFGPFFFGNYWVLDRAEDYSWAIIGEGSGKYLWILSRQAVLPEAERDALIGRAKAMGYDVGRLKIVRQPPA